ncbi:MAG: hypothetical protein CSA62_06705 [Planctomycetota bacterium]|nr:MAG: hypothetical protein CSA62_06705 [Planctomycetota bacterium]
MSLLEVIIVVALMFAISAVVSGLALGSTRAEGYVQRSVQLTGATQDLIEMVRKDVSGSTHFFVNDAAGLSYWQRLDRSAANAYSARLPKLSATGIFKKDLFGNEKSGNALLFGLLERSDIFDCGNPSGHTVRVDIYRFVAYYLHRIDGGAPGSKVDGLELIKWVSVPVADMSQVEGVTDSIELENLLKHFYQGSNPVDSNLPYPAVRYLWRQSEPIASAFHAIKADGSFVPVPATWLIPMDVKRSKLDLLSRNDFSIASNQAGSSRGIGRFGLVNLTGNGFPHGFETQIVGPASARQILMHLTTVSGKGLGLRSWGDVLGVAETRDL